MSNALTCSNCGNVLNPTDPFCSNCRNLLNQNNLRAFRITLIVSLTIFIVACIVIFSILRTDIGVLDFFFYLSFIGPLGVIIAIFLLNRGSAKIQQKLINDPNVGHSKRLRKTAFIILSFSSALTIYLIIMIIIFFLSVEILY